MDKKTFVISLGGSIIVPDGQVDVEMLKAFRQTVLRNVKRGHRFVIITGGGSVTRTYQSAARTLVKASNEDLDWIGLQATYLNAHLVRTVFGKHAGAKVIVDPGTVPKKPKAAVTVAGGWKPGRSTDDGAVRMAKRIGAHMVINLSNIDYVYDKDPRKYKSANRIEEIGWKDFRKIVGDTWDPGLSMPFDPIASKMAQSAGISVAIANGRDVKNLQRILDGKSFTGTRIG